MMLKKLPGRAATLVLAAGLVVAATPASPRSAPAPTQVYVGGKIYAEGTFEEAMAVRDGRVLAVGSAAKVRRAAGKSATVIDLNGRTVLPGLGDMHVHPMIAGNAMGNCQIPQTANGPQLLAKLAECVAARKPGEWVIGDGFSAESLKGTPITLATIDSVSPDNPVFLMGLTYHEAWANSRAFEAAGITASTPDPGNGMIQRDASGTPTGVLIEDAKALVQARIPPNTPEKNSAELAAALQVLLAQGVTMINDALVLPDAIAAYDDLADRGELHQQVMACMGYNQTLFPFTREEFERMVASRADHARPGFNPNCVKVFMDGTPTAAHTAAMQEPYLYSEMGSPPKGEMQVAADELTARLIEWDRMGLMVKLHSAGDDAVRLALDAIDAARKANGKCGPRHMIAHSTFITKADLQRARAANVTLEFSPYVWFPQPTIDEIERGLGPERMARAWPIRESLDLGILSVAGSDWPVVPNPNPWLAIEAAVTRQAPGGSAATLAPTEAISLNEAIDMFTIDAARAIGVSQTRGSIAKGKAADFIVLDRDIFSIAPTEIHGVKVLHVVTDGTERLTAPGQAPL